MNNTNKLFIPLPVLGIRVLAYSIVTFIIIIGSPGFLHKMVRNWRNRNFYIPPANQNINREALLRQYEEFVQLREDFMRRLQAEYGIQINDDFPDRIDEFLNHQEGSGFENVDALKRIQYEEVKEELTFEECPIGIMNFSDDSMGSLIYLPCDRKHIFHEKGVTAWLNQKAEGPLGKYQITDENVQNY